MIFSEKFKNWIPAFAGMTPWAIFFGTFAVYLRTCAPHVAPYRDAGEMVSLLGTFGVAHPPGYPLYTLIGKLAMWVPLGNLAYRANFFSALCAAGAIVMLFLVLRQWLGKPAALISALFLAFSNPFWELASVSEMYALGVLWFTLLLYATFVLKSAPLFGFLMALGLGVRMDMLLLIPIFALYFYFERRHSRVGGNPVSKHAVNGSGFPIKTFGNDVWGPFLFFGLGTSVFLYLLLRSHTNPIIDWGNPDTLRAVFNSASRKSYSGTLDLLSLSYSKGENFPINMQLYVLHVVKSFGWWGLALALFGVWAAFKQNRPVALFLATVFAVTGPVFLFLANMPPNPHALAIVEASYLLPDVMAAIFIGFAVRFIFQRCHPGESRDPGSQLPEKNWAPAFAGATVILVLLLGVNSAAGYQRATKRDNFFVPDYLANVSRSLPPHAIAVFQKDVQLFSLWEAQIIGRKRPDVSLISKGLSGSPWYWEMLKRWKTAPAPEISLKEMSGWKNLVASGSSRPVVAGYDADFDASTGLQMTPNGLVFALSLPGQAPALAVNPSILAQLCLYRGRYVYGETPDFFSTDLIGDHARAHHQHGFYAMMNGRPELAEWFFRRAESLDPTFSRATSDRGYLSFTRNDFAAAYARYHEASQKSARMLELAGQYKSLPAVVNGCRTDLSTNYTQLGAAAERLGKLDEARNWYNTALNVQENAQAHYNLAVTYWGRDWNQVVQHMRRALQLNPQMNEARAYLAKAESMVGRP